MRFGLLILFSCMLAYGAELSYVGSSTIGKTVFPQLAKSFSEKSGHSFTRIENPGSGQGVDALLKGKTELAGISRAIEDKERNANLRFFIIGYDAIGVVVHKDNPIKNLTMEQLRAVFGGTITNWKELGGNDAPIDVVVEILGAKRATQIVFTEIVFETKTLIGTYSKNAIEVDAPLDEVAYVKNHPNAITGVSMVFSKNSPDVKSIAINGFEAVEASIADGSYPISRPLILLTKESISEPLEQFLFYVFSKEAQELINKTFVAARLGGL